MATLVVYQNVDVDVPDWGYARSGGTTYAQARGGTGHTKDMMGFSGQRVGQEVTAAPTYYVYQSYFEFNTSALGTSAVVSAVVLEMSQWLDAPVQGFLAEVRPKDFAVPTVGTDYVPGGSIAAIALYASWNAAGFVGGYEWAVFTSLDPAFRDGINKTGMTKLMLASSRTRLNNAPTNTNPEFTTFMGGSEGANDPRLTITYTTVVVKTGSAAMTGGGVITRTSVKKASRTQAMTGGGVVALTAPKKTATRTIAATGGGVITYTAVKLILIVKTGTAAMTGGGAITLSAVKAGRLAVAATGSGVIVAASRSARSRVQAMTGGGVMVVTRAAIRRSLVTATGGGVIVIARTGTRRTVAAMTGGGVLTVSRTSARFNSLSTTVPLDGSSISPWPDLTGGTGDGVIVGSPAPVFRLPSLNGRPAISFTANEGRLRATSIPVDKDFTVVYVARMRDGTPGRVLASGEPFLVGWEGGFEDKGRA